MSVVSDYIIELGLDSIKDKVKDAVEKEKIKKELEEYLKKEKKLNEFSTIDEEIDFEGLKIYTKEYLLEDMKNCLFGDREEREFARKCMIDNAIRQANSQTEKSQKRICKFMSEVIRLIKNFYRKKCSVKNLILKNDIVEEIGIMQDEKLKECMEEIIDRTSSSSLLIKNGMKLTELGRINQVQEDMNDFIKAVGTKHQLYPYYHFEPIIDEGQIIFVSKPVSSEAIKKYPPVIKCSGEVKLGNQFINEFNENTIDYAHRHQLPIKVNVKKARKKLGDMDDPIQIEAEKFVGGEIIISPEPFPGPFPFSILIDNKVICEYILLKLEEVLDDGTKIISNKEQKNSTLIITIKVNIEDKRSGINVKIRKYSNEARLKYARFMKAASEGKRLVIRYLESETNLLVSKLDKHEYKSGFKTIDKEIDFFEKIVCVEKYFNKNVTVPEKILIEDFQSLSYMSKLINGESAEGNWCGFYCKFDLDEKIKEKVNDMGDKVCDMLYVGYTNIFLFGQEYKIPIIRTYEKAKIKDLEHLKKKIEILDNGDTLKIEYISGKKNGHGSYIDILNKEDIKTI